MNKLNLIKKLLKLPVIIVAFPFFVIAIFFATNWEDQKDVAFAKRFLKDLFW